MTFSLSPNEPVAPALDRRLGEHPGGLLERRRRQPRVGGQRRLGDPHELGTTLGRLPCPPRRAAGSCRRTRGRRPSRPGRNCESPGSDTATRRSIWRTITSTCLSWIDTPCSRYTFCTSSTRYCWVSRMPLISRIFFGSSGVFSSPMSRSPAATSWPVARPRGAPAATRRSSSSVPSSATMVTIRSPFSFSPMRTTPEISARTAAPFGRAGLEQLDDAGQTVGDVLTGDTTGVERPHGQLRAGLADRLGGDDADRLAEVDEACRWRASCRSTAAHAVRSTRR